MEEEFADDEKEGNGQYTANGDVVSHLSYRLGDCQYTGASDGGGQEHRMALIMDSKLTRDDCARLHTLFAQEAS